MTLAEYGAWFDGFSQDMPCPPGPLFWAAIKDRVCSIDGRPSRREDVVRDNPDRPRDAGGFDVIAAMEALGRAEARAVVATLRLA